jgi:hypothetical protein
MTSTETEAILSVLKRLVLAYPDRAPDSSTLDLYLEHLADIPVWLLGQAADRHIRTSIWFPRISDLRRCAAQLASRSDFEDLPRQPLDRLAAQAILLEDAFYHDGHLDPAEWQSLADQLERANRPHRRLRLLEKLAEFESNLSDRARALSPS